MERVVSDHLFQICLFSATAFASFLFLGFLEIGAEIENPFDYDSNDLDLDAFCTAVKHDLAEITAVSFPIIHLSSSVTTCSAQTPPLSSFSIPWSTRRTLYSANGTRH